MVLSGVSLNAQRAISRLAWAETARQYSEGLLRASDVVYDSVGRTVGLTDASGVEPVYWQVEYDREDHITRLTQRNGSADADASVTELVYDAVGNLTRIVEPDGEVDDFVYDAEDSLVAMHSSSGYSAEFGYDAQRNPSRAVLTQPDGTIVWDANGTALTYVPPR